MQNNSKLEHFVSQVRSQIKCKEVHDDISMELFNHIQDIADEHINSGLSEDEAIEKALHQMGDPAQVGRQLNQVHKPKTEWSLLSTVSGFTAFAVFVMYSLVVGFEQHAREFAYMSQGWMSSKLLYTVVALTVAGLLFFIDYRLVKRYARSIFVGTVLAMLLPLIPGLYVNGSPRLVLLPFTVADFVSVSPYLLLIGLAGLAANWNWDKKFTSIQAFSAFMVPSLLYFINHSSHYIITLWFVFCAVIYFTKARRLQKTMLILTSSGVIAVFTFIMLQTPYLRERFKSFLHPFSDNYMGYQTVRAFESVKSAGFLGHGFGSWAVQVPGIESELIFTYVVYAFGWLAGTLLILCVVFFVSRLMQISNMIKDPFGMLLIKGMVALFSLQFFWNIFMAIGLAPIFKFTLPFFSHGGAQLVMQAIVIGLALSVYRRKDMIPKSSEGGHVFDS